MISDYNITKRQLRQSQILIQQDPTEERKCRDLCSICNLKNSSKKHEVCRNSIIGSFLVLSNSCGPLHVIVLPEILPMMPGSIMVLYPKRLEETYFVRVAISFIF